MKKGIEVGPYGVLPDKETVGIEDSTVVPEYQDIEIKNEVLEDRETKAEHLADVRSEIASVDSSPLAKAVILSSEQGVELMAKVSQIKKKEKLALPAVARGNRTATEYDSKARNFSTITNIITLADGQKLFVVYNYSTSWIHRKLDGFMKRRTGCRMQKAKSSEWKSKFEEKSRIPTIECEDENTVVMPFVPNVNAHDLFAKRDEIKNFGECEFANNIGVEELLGIVDKIVDEIKDTHAQDVTWGELILPNIIIDKDQKVHVCDPETSYDKDVPIEEQKARDLLDFIISTAAALEKSGVEYAVSASRVLDKYGDKEIIAELKKLVSKKPRLVEKIFFGYTKARLGLKDKKQWQYIKETIANYKIL